MLMDIRLAVYIILASGAVAYGVALFPALTTTGTGTGASDVPDGTRSEAIRSQELNYCRDNVDDVNCRCFANISGLIQSDTAPRVSGAAYADKQQLARVQAGASC